MAIIFDGSATGTANNGGNATITIPSAARIAGECCIVAVTLGTSRATPTLSVTTSSGAAYTTIVSRVDSSNAHFGVFRRLLASTGETTITVTGTGNSSDSTTGVLYTFEGVDQTTPEDATPTSTSGSGTSPDSPSITVESPYCAIISAVGAQLVATLTVPSSPTGFIWQSSVSVNANDNWDSTTGLVWGINGSTSAFNPGAWTSSASASWASATIALRPATPTLLMWPELSMPSELARVEIVGY